MQLGCSLPVADIGTGPTVLRDYAQAARGAGLCPSGGARPCARRQSDRGPSGQAGRHDRDRLSRPVRAVRLSRRLHPEDRLCRRRPDPGAAPGGAGGQAGRLARRTVRRPVPPRHRGRLERVEFPGLNENFHNRGKRSAEQVRVMQALWAEPHVDFDGKFHTIDDAGINPRPARGACRSGWRARRGDLPPLRSLRRWLYAARLSGGRCRAGGVRQIARADAGSRARPGDDRARGLGLARRRRPEDWRREIGFWKAAGVTHLTAHPSGARSPCRAAPAACGCRARRPARTCRRACRSARW